MTRAERLAALLSALDQDDMSAAYEHARALAADLKVAARATNPQDINYDGVPDAHIRRVVEPPFSAAKLELQRCYYDHWRYGRSAPFHGYDVQATPAESKALHDTLSDLIDRQMAIALDDEDQKQPPDRRIPDRRRLDADGRTHRVVAEERIALRASEGVTLPAIAPRR